MKLALLIFVVAVVFSALYIILSLARHSAEHEREEREMRRSAQRWGK